MLRISANKLKFIFYLLFSLSIYVEDVVADKIKVAFINPTFPEEPFWGMVTDYMTSTAKDLDIDLQVYYSHSNRYKSLEIVQDILSSPSKPDFLIYHLQTQIGARILEAAERANVHSFVINTNIPESERQNVGKPRDKYRYWLGHMLPQDKFAGELLASALYERAIELKKTDKNGKVQMFGLTGINDNTASIDRNQGIKDFVSKSPDIKLHQIVSADWDKEKAKTITKVLMARYPNTKVIWSASDLMALGAVEALGELGLEAGKDVLVGGIDGSRLGLQAVQSGSMTTTISGHFIEGAWALLLIHDYAHGRDFIDDLGTVMQTSMEQIHAGNITSCMRIFDIDYIDNINFKAYSKVLNPDIKHYQLALPN